MTRSIGLAGGLVIALTAAGAVGAALDPALVPSTPPHPTLTGGLAAALSILANNARTLAIPFAFAMLGLARSRAGRLVGDFGVLALVVVSALNVGLALGRWGARLIPYIPQLPLEWTALALATGVWLKVRRGSAPRRELTALAAIVVLLLCAAAAVETWATPQHVDQVANPSHEPPRRESGTDEPRPFCRRTLGHSACLA